MRIERENGNVLVPYCEEADSFWKRGRGLLGRASLPAGGGLWIEPCTSIHTFFMRFTIDAVFVAASGRVVRIYHSLAPWRLSWMHLRARAVLELNSGDASRLGIREGEVLRLCREA